MLSVLAGARTWTECTGVKWYLTWCYKCSRVNFLLRFFWRLQVQRKLEFKHKNTSEQRGKGNRVHRGNNYLLKWVSLLFWMHFNLPMLYIGWIYISSTVSLLISLKTAATIMFVSCILLSFNQVGLFFFNIQREKRFTILILENRNFGHCRLFT